MAIVGPWETKRVLITARTYPTPAKKGVEVSCTAGITEEGEWIRLFPVPYRFLDGEKRFRKYQWIEVNVAKSSDYRPESYEIDIDSIRILGEPLATKHRWQARKDIIMPLKAHCLCCLEAERKATEPAVATTLGFYKPRWIRRLIIRTETPDWSPADQAKLGQYTLFSNAPFEPLEKIPYKFIYHIFCDHEECRGHHLSCTDWEMGQAYRSWRVKYGDSWESFFRLRFEKEMIGKFDTHLFVGTVFTHPASWIIVGLFYPPR